MADDDNSNDSNQAPADPTSLFHAADEMAKKMAEDKKAKQAAEEQENKE